MNIAFFIAKRIAFGSKGSFSRFIIKIAITGIVLSIATMILAVSIMSGFKQTISEKVYGFWGDVHVNHYAVDLAFEPDPLSVYQMDSLMNNHELSSIKNIAPYGLKSGLIKTANSVEGILLKGVNKRYDWTFLNKYLLEGKVIEFSDSASSKDILISRQTADRLELKLGDKMIIYFTPTNSLKGIPTARRFNISGIYKTGLEEYDKLYALVDLKHIQKLSNWSSDDVAGFEVVMNRSEGLEQISLFWKYLTHIYEYDLLDIGGAEGVQLFFNDLLKTDLEKFQIQLLSEDLMYDYLHPEMIAQPIYIKNPGIFDWLELNNVNKWIILILMCLVGIINMMTALLILILERTNMIGIMKALGGNNWTIRKVFIYNAAYITVMGLVFGNILGIGLAFFQQATGLITLPEASYYISEVPILLELSPIVLLNIGTLFIIVISLILPTFIVTKINPVKAIRFS